MTYLRGLKEGGTPSRARLVLALTVAAALLVPAAIAWACNPQAYMTLDKSSYRPGERATVSGAFFVRNTELRLRTEPGGEVGRVRTSANGAFRTQFSAPRQRGSYTLLAERADGKFQSGLPARVSFEVSTGSRRTASNESGGGIDEPSIVKSRSRETSSGSRGAGSGGGGAEPAPSASSGANADVSRTAGRDVFAGSAAPADRRGNASTEPSTARSGASERSALGDVWSGFGNGRTPSLVPSATDPTAPDGGPGSQLAWGLGLLGVGLVALLAGLTAAEVRRRRAITGR